MIFAVTKERRDTYAKLSAFIEGSTVGELAGDSSNIVELVQENYNVSDHYYLNVKFCVVVVTDR